MHIKSGFQIALIINQGNENENHLPRSLYFCCQVYLLVKFCVIFNTDSGVMIIFAYKGYD